MRHVKIITEITVICFSPLSTCYCVTEPGSWFNTAGCQHEPRGCLFTWVLPLCLVGQESFWGIWEKLSSLNQFTGIPFQRLKGVITAGLPSSNFSKTAVDNYKIATAHSPKVEMSLSQSTHSVTATIKESSHSPPKKKAIFKRTILLFTS